MAAPAAVVFNKVNDFKNWPQFSPWAEKEPTAALTYGDTTVGEGGFYAWNGEILGEGYMETLSTRANEQIAQTINFIEPFEARSNINWTFTPEGEQTRVTWQMEGKKDFVSKLATIFMGSIEDMTGPDFERGLFKLDSLLQADMRVYKIDINGTVAHSGGYYLYKTTSCKFSELQTKMTELMPQVAGYAITHNISFAGKPFVRYHQWDRANDAIIFSSCIPTTTKIMATESDILTGQLEPFEAIKTTLTGDYNNLEEAWLQTMDYIAQNELELAAPGYMLEYYLTDPMDQPNPADWITEIYVGIK
jgi:ribosome-associated toxin RatA of RatAB toxin-antitoxin module